MNQFFFLEASWSSILTKQTNWPSQICYGHFVLGRNQSVPEMKNEDMTVLFFVYVCMFSVSPISSAEAVWKVNRGQAASIIFAPVCQSFTSISWPVSPPVHHRSHCPLYTNNTTWMTWKNDEKKKTWQRPLILSPTSYLHHPKGLWLWNSALSSVWTNIHFLTELIRSQTDTLGVRGGWFDSPNQPNICSGHLFLLFSIHAFHCTN